MATTKTTEELFSGNGSQTSFPFTIEYLKTSDITVKVSGVLQTETTHYSVVGTNIVFVTAPSTGTNNIRVTRVTNIDTPRSVYAAGSSIRAKDLNSNQDQILFKLQEQETRSPSATVSATAPTDPLSGDTWYDTVLGRSFVYYEAQWVESNPAFDADEFTVNITDTNVATNAAIQQSKLNLSITNSEVNNSAAIDASKLSYTSAGSTTARTLASKFGDVLNVKDYGAVGNGTTNDTTAIQNTINALPDTGGVVVFPPGKYLLGSSLTLTQAANQNAVILQGLAGNAIGLDNYGARLFRADGDTDPYITITNARSIQIKDLAFIGGTFNNGSGTGVKPNGTEGAIDVTANAGCQEHVYENLYFNGITQCISLKGLSSSIIRNCKFRQVPEGSANDTIIRLTENGSEPMDQMRIENCILDGSPNATSSSRNNTVRGITIDLTVSTVFITNTSVIRANYGYFVNSTWDGNFIYFQNAEAERSEEDGFSLNGTGNYITLDNCFSCTNEEQGINIGTSQDSSVNITNPNVRDNKKHGIMINSPTENVSIINPAIGGNSNGSSGTYHGIDIATASNYIYISGGKVGGVTEDLGGTGPQDYGINVNGNDHDHIRIIGVDVTDNQESVGILWTTSGGNVDAASDNFIQFCPGYSAGQTSFP